MPSPLIKSFLKLQNFKVLPLKKIKSNQGKEIQGYIIACSLLPSDIEDLNNLDEELLLDEIISAGFIAQDLGVKIMGLGGELALAADKKPMIYKHLKTPITNGSTFTAWSIFEEIFKTSKQNKIDLKKANLTIIDPGNAVGSLCARKFSEHVLKTTLTSGSHEKSQMLKETMTNPIPVGVEIEEDVRKAVEEADIVINTYNGNTTVLNVADLKPNCIFCDGSVSKSLFNKAKLRRDIILIEGGMIKLPFSQTLGVNLGLPKDLISASIAETMLLALEEKFVNYSLGENINPDKLEDIADIAVRHGFEVSVA
jgi:predicted amino acid dehydrogenase